MSREGEIPALPTVWSRDHQECKLQICLATLKSFFVTVPIPMIPIKLEQDDDDGVSYSG